MTHSMRLRFPALNR
ncbi:MULTISPECIES: erythromycin resistance leader peptide [Paenibacillus]|uniref:Uncharacterized protein n=1 Tax=Paenibacillus campinasensis TaxID=66347 RepID=A0ABW9T5J7_9BACL|nr:hypothetical protein [Paenibacillus campinasensis]